MPTQAAIQGKAAYGYAKAASILGAPVQQIRPTGPLLPLQQPPLATLSAFFDQNPAFTMAKPWSRRTAGGTEGFAALDTTNVLLGDLLVGADTYFVSRVEPIRPCEVILTNAVLDVLGGITTDQPGYGGYRGRTVTTETVLASGWPAAKHAGGRSETAADKLASDARVPSWSVLLPPIPGITITRQSVLRDAYGQTFTVSAAEFGPFGWSVLCLENDV